MPNPGPQSDAYLSLADELYFGGAAGGGKLLSLYEPVPVPGGWSSVGQLRVGDELFDENGHVCRVTALSAIDLNPKSYRLTFDDGTRIEACADHLWLTYDAKELASLTRRDPKWRKKRRDNRPSRSAIGAGQGKGFSESHREYLSAKMTARNKACIKVKPAPSGTVRTTQQIHDTLTVKGGRANHAVPVAKALETPAIELPIDPYLLGVWLGDGCSRHGSITSADPEIFEAFDKAGFVRGSCQNQRGSKASSLYFYGFKTMLRGLGLLQNKHIPEMYLRASKKQRLELLRGLMDTDGTACKTGSVEFTNTNKHLMDGFYELVVSLGWKGRVVESRAMLYGRDCGPVWNLKWSPSEYVFRLERKRCRQKLTTRRTTRFRYIVACDPCESTPMRCIRVDSPSHLFLVSRSMVPTHNSMALIGMALTAHRNSLLLRRTAKDTKALSDSLRSLGYGRWKWDGNGGELVTPDNRVINVGGCQNIGDEQSYQGHAHDGKFFDELAHFAEQQYTFIIGWNRVRDPRRYPNQRCRVVGAGNPPTDPEGEWVLRRWRAWMPGADRPAKPGELRWYTTINGEEIECEDGKPIVLNGVVYQPRSRTFIPARLEDNPELMRTGYAATLEALPEPLRSMMRYGDMMASRTDGRWQLIPTRWVVEAQKRWMERKDSLGVLRMAGCDVAMEGKDKTCIALRYGDPTPEKGATIGSIIRRKGTETPDGQTVVALFMGLGGTAIINIDAIGLGKSAYDVAVMMGLGTRVRPIVVSNAANWRDTRMPQIKFANLRAAMMWRVRSLLDPEGGAPETRLALPPDPELLGDMTAPNYSMRSGGIIVESKDEIKKRIGRSTDAGDSVALACWERPGYVVS